MGVADADWRRGGKERPVCGGGSGGATVEVELAAGWEGGDGGGRPGGGNGYRHGAIERGHVPSKLMGKVCVWGCYVGMYLGTYFGAPPFYVDVRQGDFFIGPPCLSPLPTVHWHSGIRGRV